MFDGFMFFPKAQIIADKTDIFFSMFITLTISLIDDSPSGLPILPMDIAEAKRTFSS